MLNEILLGIIQGITEFLPISSDGHLAIASKLLGETNLLFITFLHLASLLAVIIFTRKELIDILRFDKKSFRYILFIFIGIVPAIITGIFLSDLIEKTLSCFLLISIFFLFNGLFLFFTKYSKNESKSLSLKNSFLIGLVQSLALLPGVSRSGMTISTGLFLGIEKEKIVKFSFIMFIPLAIGAFALEFVKHQNMLLNISIITLIFYFAVCFVINLLCLNLLNYIVKTNKFWIFGLYCFLVSIISFILYFTIS